MEHISQQRLESSPRTPASTGHFIQNQPSVPALPSKRMRIPDQTEQATFTPQHTSYRSTSIDRTTVSVNDSHGYETSPEESLRGIGEWASTADTTTVAVATNPCLEEPMSMFCPYHRSLLQEIIEAQNDPQHHNSFKHFRDEDLCTILHHPDANSFSSYTDCSKCQDAHKDLLH